MGLIWYYIFFLALRQAKQLSSQRHSVVGCRLSVFSNPQTRCPFSTSLARFCGVLTQMRSAFPTSPYSNTPSLPLVELLLHHSVAVYVMVDFSIIFTEHPAIFATLPAILAHRRQQWIINGYRSSAIVNADTHLNKPSVCLYSGVYKAHKSLAS